MSWPAPIWKMRRMRRSNWYADRPALRASSATFSGSPYSLWMRRTASATCE